VVIGTLSVLNTKCSTELEKKLLINNQIRASKVRVIDEDGKNLGVFPLEEALKMAKERNLDLIQITDKADPPVCKISDYGKFLYQLKKREKDKKKERGGETKGIRLGFNISDHDMEIRVNQAKEFLEEGNRVQIEMILRGREKLLENFANEKIKRFLEILESKIPIKVEQELKKVPRGFIMIISKK
jgi:translation initiation factor IF-3